MRIALLCLGLLAGGCGSSVKTCPSGQVCANTPTTGDFCTTSCHGLDGGGCPSGQSCIAAGPCCAPGQACPAIALFVCK